MPILPSEQQVSLEQSQEHAASIASELRPGDVVALYGEVGAGKTSWVRAAIQALIGSEIVVASPTFNLVLTYATSQGMVWHFDLYRLKYMQEVIEIGWEEARAEGIVLVEWPQLIEDLLPKNVLRVEFITLDEDVRMLKCSRGE